MKATHKILLFNLALSLGVGIVCFTALQLGAKRSDFGMLLLVGDLIFVLLQILACWVLSLVFFVKKNTGKGLGFLLSGIAVGVVGFGTCSAMLIGG